MRAERLARAPHVRTSQWGVRITPALAEQIDYERRLYAIRPSKAETITQLVEEGLAFRVHLYAALAEKERRLISQRTKDALAAKKAQGVKLGGLNAKGIANREDAKARAEALRPLLAELSHLSANAIAAELNKRGVATPTGSPWSAVTVIRVQKRLRESLS